MKDKNIEFLRNRKIGSLSFRCLFYNFSNRIKINFLSHRLGRTHARSSYFHSLSSLSLSFISPYLLLHQPCDPYSFICFCPLTAFVVYFICFFFRLSYRPSERKAETSHHSFEDIHHPSTQIFNKTSTASATQPLLCFSRRCASCAVLNISSHL